MRIIQITKNRPSCQFETKERHESGVCEVKIKIKIKTITVNK